MGGRGSGSHYHWWRAAKKRAVEDCLSLDADRWTGEGILRAGVRRCGTWGWTYLSGRKCSVAYEALTQDMAKPQVRLAYSWSDGTGREWRAADYPVRLAVTHPGFGGLRWWFLCPLVNCGR